MSIKDSETATIQKNGYIVMDALHSLKEPVTLGRLIKQIAETHNLKSDRIREPIRTVLKTGLEFGFLQRDNGRYSVCGDNVIDEDENSNCNDADEFTDNEVVDACVGTKKRKKRKKSSSSSRRQTRKRLS